MHLTDCLCCLGRDGAPRTRVMFLSPEQKNVVVSSLQPVVEAWVGQKLLPSSVYGVRLYTRNATFEAHVRTPATSNPQHLISGKTSDRLLAFAGRPRRDARRVGHRQRRAEQSWLGVASAYLRSQWQLA